VKNAVLVENIDSKFLTEIISVAVKEEFEKLKKDLYIEREKMSYFQENKLQIY